MQHDCGCRNMHAYALTHTNIQPYTCQISTPRTKRCQSFLVPTTTNAVQRLSPQCERSPQEHSDWPVRYRMPEYSFHKKNLSNIHARTHHLPIDAPADPSYPRAHTGLDVFSLLIMPVQRMPRFRTLLETFIKATPTHFSDTPDLDTALQAIKRVISHTERETFRKNGLAMVSVRMYACVCLSLCVCTRVCNKTLHINLR